MKIEDAPEILAPRLSEGQLIPGCPEARGHSLSEEAGQVESFKDACSVLQAATSPLVSSAASAAL
eukprot:COSAG06_NODE_33517_length_488_cov_1.187661_2_plen_64_part_01